MRALLKTTWMELKLFTREPMTVLFTFAIPVVILYVLGGVFGNTPDPKFYRGFGAMNFYVPAYIMLVVAAMGLIALPVHLASYRERGVLRRFRASSVPLWSVYGAQVAVTLILSLLGSLFLVGIAWLIYHPRTPESLFGVLGVFVLGALTFAMLGLFLGLALPTARAAQGAGVLLWFVLMMISGTGPPFEVLPTSLVQIGDATPLKHLVLLLQDPWMGVAWGGMDALFLVGFLAACTGLSVFFVRRR